MEKQKKIIHRPIRMTEKMDREVQKMIDALGYESFSQFARRAIVEFIDRKKRMIGENK